MRILTLLLIILLSAQFVSGQYKIEVLDSTTFTLSEGVILSKTSFRGLSVVDDKTIWVSGSRGTFARSTDGGKTFTYTQVKGYEKSDFRDIEAFDANRAVMMSSGTPAYILTTTDGGLTWKEAYKNIDTAYFLDAMDFWDSKRGMIVGDPIHNHFVLLQTEDGGSTWKEMDTTKTPIAMEEEAVFAASGTSLRCWGKDEFGFVTGGSYSRLIERRNGYNHFQFTKLPIIQGKSSQGSFSLVYPNDLVVAIVGGDYLVDTLFQRYTVGVFVDSLKRNYEWNFGNLGAKYGTHGYRSSIELISNLQNEAQLVIACGTSGVEFHNEHWLLREDQWRTISKESFNVVRKAKKGKAVFLAGGKGRIGKLIY